MRFSRQSIFSVSVKSGRGWSVSWQNSIRKTRNGSPRKVWATTRGPNTEGRSVLGGLNPTLGREQARLRPVLILSQEIFNKRSETVIAMAITSQPQKAGFPLSYMLPGDVLPKPSWVKISQIRTISVDRLGKKIAPVDAEDLNRIVEGLLELIG